MSNDIKDIYSRNLDILSEIGNIGAGNATTALAQIIGNKVNMDVPQVRLLGFNELTEIVGGAENIVIGIMCRIEGDLTGMMMSAISRPLTSGWNHPRVLEQASCPWQGPTSRAGQVSLLPPQHQHNA